MREAMPLEFGECPRCRIPHVLKADGGCPFRPDDVVQPGRRLGWTFAGLVLIGLGVVVFVGFGFWALWEAFAHGVRAVTP